MATAPVRGLLAAFLLTGVVFLTGCQKRVQFVPVQAYPAGTPAELATDCKVGPDGKTPIEPCHFLLKPIAVKLISEKSR